MGRKRSAPQKATATEHYSAKRHATERAQSSSASGTATEHALKESNLAFNALVNFLVKALHNGRERQFTADDCREMVLNTRVRKWYDEAALQKHLELWNLVNLNKDGMKRENTFFLWCRKIADWARSADEDTATQHAQDPAAHQEEEDHNIYTALARNLLLSETTLQQRQETKYQIKRNKCGEMLVPTAQRSWIHNMLRKFLGHADVAWFIWRHGLPELFDAPWHRGAANPKSPQRILESGMRWHASLLRSLVQHHTLPEKEDARVLSNDGMGFQRRKALSDAKKAIHSGKCLCEQRDAGEKYWDDMSATEQQWVEDFDTGRAQRRYDKMRITQEKQPFRGSLWPTDT